ncbi:MAG: UPF0280 family protein [Candidatus Helarchaeota archaeon]
MKNLYSRHTIVKESDIFIKTDIKKAIDEALLTIKKNRAILINYIRNYPEFKTSFKPIKINKDAPLIIRMMALAAEKCDVGPMAAVAGALADLGVDTMKKNGAKVCIIENGGEICAEANIQVDVGIYAGESILSEKIGFRLRPKDFPIGIGTSSGTVGHAFSYGVADAAIAFTNNATLADAAATAIGNEVRGKDIEKSIQNGLEIAETIDGVRGAFIILGDKAGTVGKLPQFIKIKGAKSEILKNKFDFLTDIFKHVY